MKPIVAGFGFVFLVAWLLGMRGMLWISGEWALGTIPKATRRLVGGSRGFAMVGAGPSLSFRRSRS
jgi:hypothetical protein